MTAKREVSRLYEDVKQAAYIVLFNPSVSALKMWRAVPVMRAVDSFLKDGQANTEGRDSPRDGDFAGYSQRDSFQSNPSRCMKPRNEYERYTRLVDQVFSVPLRSTAPSDPEGGCGVNREVSL